MSAAVAAGCLVSAAVALAAGRGRSMSRYLPLVLPRPSGRLVVAGLAVGICALVAGAALVAGRVAAALAAVAVLTVAHRVRAARGRAARRAEGEAEVEVLAALAAELRAGRQPVFALACAGAGAGAGPGLVGAALAAAGAVAELGGDVAVALRRDATASPVLHRLAAAWQVSELAGVPLAAVVNRVEAEVRAVAAARERARVELAGARATGGLLAALPLLGVCLGAAMGAHPVQVLLHTPFGAACCACGVILELVGLTWIGRLTSAATDP